MQKIVGIRFKSAGKVYYFDPQQIYLKLNDNVIVETARGLEFGTVVSRVRNAEDEEIKHPIKPVVRKATLKDEKTHEHNLKKAQEAMDICREEIEKHKLNMKLIRSEYTFDASKVIFYFTADGRIDFRELVKDLASIFRIRIELRQVGVRDEAKMLGGIGSCGRPLCCNKWLGDFEPVSIKMAKEQGLSLNPGKISGICGRLLCCLQYEHECYECALMELPEVGDRVKTPDGMGTVQNLATLAGKVTVKLDGEELNIKQYDKSQIKTVSHRREKNARKENRTRESLEADELAELKQLEKGEKFDENDDI